MKSTTAEYKTSMAQILRERSYVQINFAHDNSAAASAGTWTTNGAATYSAWDTSILNDGTYAYPQTVATLELNRWTLDASQVLLDSSGSTQTDGYTSTAISDEQGVFSTTPQLTYEMSDEYNLEGFTLVFDDRAEEWPIDATVYFYSNGTTIDVQGWGYIGNLDSPRHIIAFDIDDVDKIVIYGDNVLPYHRFRVQTTSFGLAERWGNADITGITKVDDIDPISRRLPEQTVEFSLIDYDGVYDPENPSGLSHYMQTKSPLSVTFGYDVNGDGVIEWLQSDRYYLYSNPVWNHGIATFTAVKKLGILTDLYRRGNYGPNMPFDGSLPVAKTLRKMALDVLNDAGVTDYIVDNSLDNIACSGVMPVVTHAEALQMIAHAGCCRLYCDSSDNVCIEQIDTSDYAGMRGNFLIDNTSITEKSLALEKTEQCKSVSVNLYNAAPENLWASEVEQGTLDNDGQPVSATNRLRTTAYMPISPGSYKLDITSSQTLWCWIFIYDESFNYVAAESSTDWIQSNTAQFDVTINGYIKFCWRNAANTTLTASDITNAVFTGTTEFIRSGMSDEIGSIFESDSPYGKYSVMPDYMLLTPNPYIFARYCSFRYSYPVTPVPVSIYAMPVYEDVVDVKSEVVEGTGEEDIEDNVLVTSAAIANALKTQIADYLTLRDTYTLDYRGNPELEAGDVIGLQTRYNADRDVLVLRHEITFNGALHGNLTVKGL